MAEDDKDVGRQVQIMTTMHFVLLPIADLANADLQRMAAE